MILDVRARFCEAALRIRDDCELRALDDNDYKDKMGKAFMIYTAEYIMAWVDGLLEITNDRN